MRDVDRHTIAGCKVIVASLRGQVEAHLDAHCETSHSILREDTRRLPRLAPNTS